MPSTFTLQKAQSGGDLTITTYNTTLTQIEVAVRALQDASASIGTVTSFSTVSTALSQIFTTNVATSTTTPALTFSVVTKAANLIYASPTTGSAAAPTFRSLVVADLPTVTFAKGGIGLTTLGTAHQIPKINTGATAYEMASISAGSSKITITPSAGIIALDVAPANIDKNTLGGSALSIANGGSGGSTQQTAINALTNVSAATNEYVLTKDTATGFALWKLATNIAHTGEVTGTTVLTITAAAVTYAKMQNFAATSIIGNHSASAATASSKTVAGNILFNSSVFQTKDSIVSTKTANYQMVSTDGKIEADASSGAITISLPDVATITVGHIFQVSKIDIAANVVISVEDIATDYINGATTLTLTHQYNTAEVQYVGVIGGRNTFRVLNKIIGA